MVNRNKIDEVLLQILEANLPDMFTRAIAEEKIGGFLTARSLANLNNQGKGPKPRKIGRKVLYAKAEFIEWVKQTYGVEHAESAGIGGQVCGSEGTTPPAGTASQ